WVVTYLLRPLDRLQADMGRRHQCLRRLHTPPSSPAPRQQTAVEIQIVGMACCARATSGHAAAAPPRSVMNSRRFMSDMGACSPAFAKRRTPEGHGAARSV